MVITSGTRLQANTAKKYIRYQVPKIWETVSPTFLSICEKKTSRHFSL